MKMNKNEIMIRRILCQVNMKDATDLDIYFGDSGYIKLAITDKGTPVILVKEMDKAIIGEWEGHKPFRRKMNDIWDEENADIEVVSGDIVDEFMGKEEDQPDDDETNEYTRINEIEDEGDFDEDTQG